MLEGEKKEGLGTVLEGKREIRKLCHERGIPELGIFEIPSPYFKPTPFLHRTIFKFSNYTCLQRYSPFPALISEQVLRRHSGNSDFIGENSLIKNLKEN